MRVRFSPRAPVAYYRSPVLNPDKNLQAYIIGIAIGDGNLSNMDNGVSRLRVSCDRRYPKLIRRIIRSIRQLLPENKINTIGNGRNCLNVYVYSNHLEQLLGWKGSQGSKFKQKVSTPKWILKKDKYKIEYLRGLIETDGSVYNDRGYSMMMFATIIPDLAMQVDQIIHSLGFNSHIYKIPKERLKSKYKSKDLYHVRLSKDVGRFINLVRVDKS